MKVLVINAGSSSLKYQLFDMEDECADKVDAMTVKLRVAMTNHYDTSTFIRFRWHIK